VHIYMSAEGGKITAPKVVEGGISEGGIPLPKGGGVTIFFIFNLL